MFNLQTFQAYRAASGDQKIALRNQIVQENTPLVKKLVDKNIPANSGDREELMQAGFIGLLRAIEKYDPDWNTKSASNPEGKRPSFSTCAGLWIKHEVQQCALKQVGLCRPRLSGMPYQVALQMEEFRKANGREATAKDLTYKGKQITQVEMDAWHSFAETDYLDSMDEITDGPVHRATPDLGNETSLHTFLTDPDAVSAHDQMERGQSLTALQDSIGKLDKRERRIIHGLFYEDQTYTQLAKDLGMSEERVRQIRNAAMVKLRAAQE